jgi:predicted acylesterase/phospholipase RssA
VKRALVLAGGGLKVAFQAGVLQVWLDEAQLRFPQASAASGGVFNLAMLCEGRSGTQIADAWRRFRPLRGLSPDWREAWKLPFAGSLLSYDRFRKNVLRKDWGLDWDAIRATALEATFDVYDFSHHVLEAVPAQRMSEDLLVGAVSLPMWFPPVSIAGDLYVDAVYATDANLEEALRHGADELWIVWTVSRAGAWRKGFVPLYFQQIEQAANARLRADLARIRRSNLLIADGQAGEFGRPVEVRLLEAEVPLHYLIELRNRPFREAVELGVAAAREWCEEQGVALGARPAPARPQAVSLAFDEVMWGWISPGRTTEWKEAFESGEQAGRALRVELTIAIDDLARFVAEPEHQASARGWVECAHLGGRFAVQEGRFNLFVDLGGDPARRRMLYRLFFAGPDGMPLTLAGEKVIRDDPGFDLWADTTTLYTRVFRGHVEPDGEPGAEVVATGILLVHLTDFLHQLTTFRARGASGREEARALVEFGRFFLGRLWDVYLRRSIVPSPF